MQGHAQIADAVESGALAGEELRKLVYDLTVRPDSPEQAGIELVDAMFMDPAGKDLARMIRRGIVTANDDAEVAPYDTPALVVHGTNDQSVPLALAERLASLGSNATLVAIEGAGHFVQIFHAERVARAAFAGG